MEHLLRLPIAYTVVPLATEPGISLIILNTNEDIATKYEQEYFRYVRNVTT
jgi:hypothetical protein